MRADHIDRGIGPIKGGRGWRATHESGGAGFLEKEDPGWRVLGQSGGAGERLASWRLEAKVFTVCDWRWSIWGPGPPGAELTSMRRGRWAAIREGEMSPLRH
jgi:hypothetical protein